MFLPLFLMVRNPSFLVFRGVRRKPSLVLIPTIIKPSLYTIKNDINAYLLVATQHVDEAERKRSKALHALAKVKDYHYEIQSKSCKLKELSTDALQAVNSLNAAENQITELTNENKELVKQLSEAMDRVNKVTGDFKRAVSGERQANSEKDAIQAKLDDLNANFSALCKETEKFKLDLDETSRKLYDKNAALMVEQERARKDGEDTQAVRVELERAQKLIAEKDLSILSKDEEIERLRKHVTELEPLTHPLPHVLNWVKQDSYMVAASFTERFAGPDATQEIRKVVLRLHPDIDLNQLRLFEDERIRKNGETMVHRTTTLPPVFFDTDGLDAETILRTVGRALSKNLRYSTLDLQPDEVPLLDAIYDDFRSEYETCLRKQRKRLCDEQGTEYKSSDDEVDKEHVEEGEVDAQQDETDIGANL